MFPVAPTFVYMLALPLLIPREAGRPSQPPVCAFLLPYGTLTLHHRPILSETPLVSCPRK